MPDVPAFPRVLQVATATYHLSALARLQALFPGLHVTTQGFLIPLQNESPEEVLSTCVREGVRVVGSRVVHGVVGPSLRFG